MAVRCARSGASALFVGLSLFSGCIQAPACERYLAAEEACHDQAVAADVSLADVTWDEPDCRSVRGDEMHGGTTKNYVCLAHAYDDADCSTRAGLMSAKLSEMPCH